MVLLKGNREEMMQMCIATCDLFTGGGTGDTRVMLDTCDHYSSMEGNDLIVNDRGRETLVVDVIGES